MLNCSVAPGVNYIRAVKPFVPCPMRFGGGEAVGQGGGLSARGFWRLVTWGLAPGWYGVGPLALSKTELLEGGGLQHVGRRGWIELHTDGAAPCEFDLVGDNVPHDEVACACPAAER